MKVTSILVLASALCTVPTVSLMAQDASAPQTQTQPAAKAKKQKTVKFTLNNTTAHPMDLKSGSEPLTLQPGQSREMKVPAGTQITKANASDSAQSGTVVTEVSDGMSGTTVNLRD